MDTQVGVVMCEPALLFDIVVPITSFFVHLPKRKW